MFISLVTLKKPVSVSFTQCLKAHANAQPRFTSSSSLSMMLMNTRRSFFNSSSNSNYNSSSSSFNYSAQSNGHSTNTDELNSVFTYNIAVSYQPKDREAEKGTLYQNTYSNRVHEDRVSPTGEDNYLIAVNKELKSVCVGVADGVGGWSEWGFDSSAIARELCKELKTIFEKNTDETTTTTTVDPKRLLKIAFDKVIEKGIVQVGGTTICFGVISPLGKLTTVNLGDSWFGVFRPNNVITSGSSSDVKFECIHQSTDQTHGFNIPYQMSIIPLDLLQLSVSQGRKLLQDDPSVADVYPDFQLQRDDIVVFATDGVTDNVCPEDISMFISDEYNKRHGEVDELGILEIDKKLVGDVHKLSKDHQFPSVFAQKLSNLLKQKYTGGKMDDITIVMLQVV